VVATIGSSHREPISDEELAAISDGSLVGL
jgi:hypothetical protein